MPEMSDQEFIKEMDNVITKLVCEGLVEPAGISEGGDMTFQLTKAGEDALASPLGQAYTALIAEEFRDR